MFGKSLRCLSTLELLHELIHSIFPLYNCYYQNDLKCNFSKFVGLSNTIQGGGHPLSLLARWGRFAWHTQSWSYLTSYRVRLVIPGGQQLDSTKNAGPLFASNLAAILSAHWFGSMATLIFGGHWTDLEKFFSAYII